MSEEKKNLTVFQRATNVFSFGGNDHVASIPAQPNYPQDKEIITAATPEEYNTRELEYKQQFFIEKQFDTIVRDGDQKAIEAQSNRIPAYMDYILMETYPTIAQALNVLSEEATTIGENGKMLTVYSNNKQIKKDLESLFYDILDINTALPYWARNMCKYGDNFLYLLTKKGQGIVGARQLPNFEIERKETTDTNNKVQTKFIWQTKSQEYTMWQVAHFRLLGDDRFLPYGSSILAPVRQTWRMLKMSEDAMLVYRAERASERRVVKVNVGNADPNDVAMLVQQAAQRFKKASLVDPKTGNVNYKFNPATVQQDIFIAVRSDNAANPIDTLAGASNLSDIEDITYLRDNLFTGLGVPKVFLGFSSDASSDGGGKNLSQLDVRFARKTNKIQQCLLQELNKMAIIHLVLLGYGDEDLREFKLSLANPSTQSDMLKLEHWTQKVDLYSKMTTANDNGIRPMSDTKAKREILEMSDDEIVEDLRQQFIENAIGEEIKNSTLIVKNSKFFNDFRKYYSAGVLGNKSEENPEEGLPQTTGEEGVIPETQPTDQTQPEGSELPETLQEQFKRKNSRLNEDMLDLLKSLKDKKGIL